MTPLPVLTAEEPLGGVQHGERGLVTAGLRRQQVEEAPGGRVGFRGAGGHFIVVVPYLDLVVVHRVNTDIEGRVVTDAQFGHLFQLILDAHR